MPLFCTKRDVVLASLERYDSDQRCYILALCSTEHPLIQDAHKSNFVRYIKFVTNCAVPENIHTHPKEGDWKFRGGGGKEGKYEAKLEGWGQGSNQKKHPWWGYGYFLEY